jgi:hypothetical protein
VARNQPQDHVSVAHSPGPLRQGVHRPAKANGAWPHQARTILASCAVECPRTRKTISPGQCTTRSPQPSARQCGLPTLRMFVIGAPPNCGGPRIPDQPGQKSSCSPSAPTGNVGASAGGGAKTPFCARRSQNYVSAVATRLFNLFPPECVACRAALLERFLLGTPPSRRTAFRGAKPCCEMCDEVSVAFGATVQACMVGKIERVRTGAGREKPLSVAAADASTRTSPQNNSPFSSWTGCLSRPPRI